MKPVFASLFIIFLSFSAIAQDLSDYHYVVVPERYGFQAESNQYELNEMTKFYLGKHGFQPFFNNEVLDFERCDGLYLDVEEVRAFLGTRLQIVLRDCKREVIYTSAEGYSKHKEFKKGYQDALRKAFDSFASLKVNQSPMVSKTKPSGTNTESVATETPADVAAPSHNGPNRSLTAYTYQRDSYLLRKTSEGYSLFQETEEEDSGLRLVGKITYSDDEALVFNDTEGEQRDAKFDRMQNLVIDTKEGQVRYEIVE